jgi:gas vesicle protein
MKTGRALLGVAAGLAAGAVLGMLFAPEKEIIKNNSHETKDLGDELNKKIDEKFDELINAITAKSKKA